MKKLRPRKEKPKVAWYIGATIELEGILWHPVLE